MSSTNQSLSTAYSHTLFFGLIHTGSMQTRHWTPSIPRCYCVGCSLPDCKTGHRDPENYCPGDVSRLVNTRLLGIRFCGVKYSVFVWQCQSAPLGLLDHVSREAPLMTLLFLGRPSEHYDFTCHRLNLQIYDHHLSFHQNCVLARVTFFDYFRKFQPSD